MLSNKIIFAFFLFIGLVTGFVLATNATGVAVEPEPALRPGTNDLKQHNMLVVAVEQIDGTASRVEAIWLAMHFEDSFDYTFLPIYPEVGGSAGASEAIYFNASEGQSLEQLAILQEKEVLWNDALIIDRAGVRAILQHAEGGGLSLAQEADGQQDLLQWLCEHNQHLGGEEGLGLLMALRPAHLVTTVNEFKLIEMWHQLSSQDTALRCEFPTFSN